MKRIISFLALIFVFCMFAHSWLSPVLTHFGLPFNIALIVAIILSIWGMIKIADTLREPDGYETLIEPFDNRLVGKRVYFYISAIADGNQIIIGISTDGKLSSMRHFWFPDELTETYPLGYKGWATVSTEGGSEYTNKYVLENISDTP